jgi:hypothetical protein
VLALVLAVVGTTALVIGITGQQSAPRPAAGTRTAPTDTDDVAAPVSVAVPSIGVTSDPMRLGLNDDGTLQVPPLSADDRAGWYERGPPPVSWALRSSSAMSTPPSSGPASSSTSMP